MRAEDAHKTLQDMQVKWEETYKSRAKQAAEPARTFAQDFLDLHTFPYYKRTERHHQLEKQLPQTLFAMTPAERTRVFQVLFPRIAEDVERTWQMLDALPYQIGYSRKSFRIQGHGVNLQKKWHWMQGLWQLTRHYEENLHWFVVWAGHIGSYQGDILGYLFAAAINHGDEEVLQVLKDTASTEHDIGLMGRHVTRALLSCSREDAWTYCEKLLLAAQRQEGLRQVILETVDEAHPEAFVRMVKLILSEDLLRFSSVMRAVGVWLGFNMDVTERKTLETHLQTFLTFLQDEQSLQNALEQGNGQNLYIALMAVGFKDARQTLELGETVLSEADVERRYAAAQVMQATGLPEFGLYRSRLMQDPDLRIATMGIPYGHGSEPADLGADAFEQLVALGERLPKDSKQEPLLWPWLGYIAGRSTAFNLLPNALGNRPKSDLLPHIPGMDSWHHGYLLRGLKEEPLEAGPLRQHVVESLGSTDEFVRGCAFEALEKRTLTETETLSIEALFNRKGSDVRQKAAQLLLNQPVESTTQSAGRLVKEKKTDLRMAGLDLLTQLVRNKTTEKAVQGLLSEVLEIFTPKNPNETQLFDALRVPDEQLTLQNGLGLFDEEKLSGFQEPRWIKRDYARKGLIRHLLELNRLIEHHKDTEITLKDYFGESQTYVLGNLFEYSWTHQLSRQEVFPLGEVWKRWWETRPNPQDHDLTQLIWQFEKLGFDGSKEEERHPLLKKLTQPTGLKRHLIEHILQFLKKDGVPSGAIDFLLDAFESHLSLIDREAAPLRNERGEVLDPRARMDHLSDLASFQLEDFSSEQIQRLWSLSLCYNRGFRHFFKSLPDFTLAVHAWKKGFASEHDLLNILIGWDSNDPEKPRTQFHDLSHLTSRKPAPLLEQFPELSPIVERIRERVLEVEKDRTDLPTAASRVATHIKTVYGAEHTLKLLAGLGKDSMTRGYVQNELSKTAVFSRLIRVSFPAPEDTVQDFSKQVKALSISNTRLLELAVYAPQWAEFVEKHLGWTGLSGAIFWLLAHTKDTGYFVDQQVREVWEAEIAERTPLSPQDLLDGAVDVQWFREVILSLGEKRFAELLKASRYLSSTGAQKRAELYAKGILGQADEKDLLQNIKTKRHQDSVRAIGLLPTTSDTQTLSRYKVLQAFLKESKQFGAQKQASEQRAARIGLHNLARSAGYIDPERLMWQMETLEVQGLQGRQVTIENVTLTLQVDEEGTPSIHIEKAGKALKSIPAALKKHPEVVALSEGKRNLEQQKSRMREAFEQAMVRGDHFTLKEVQTLYTHPVVKPMLQSLLWVRGERDLGFSDGMDFIHLENRTALTDEGYRLAHPHDLLQSGQWREWQKHCFEHEVQQPFKQIFREYYLPAPHEQEALKSTRYEGQQLNPRQSLALLKTRNWVTVPEEGARKTFHTEGLNVWLYFQEGFYTPLDIEGLTVSHVVFTERGKWEPLPISSVPPRIFSEVMRDVDLIVSVAHIGGVDPEASQSTVEMRSSLIQETLRLLKIDNVELKNTHALIKGHHADYSIHLGSGTVHRHPGGALCIIPVHSQHRGRIFLPFADNDPKTAEVISKVLLLAKDRQIQDPTILEQLR
ncbi:DUF4132 domain-containing protein [Deinococcus cellulosilyticus]|uniref:DUF4132 domain-containing protein n=1 Tax=Deinococcus cellulosilyticus (strain DSM 18568 / NBRC 106333 / KACC 11606 / 5516J-15) TaxID=1223518 RepID=A0A511N341_DEIC1|nr:DUF4132 domain-containing protein [Deinococcus cellulosilyticus]GEM46917.1 hypothetical protein DC3_25520 [Deinococcus cellulosilyticus NBRC 106333 = KACC 11606]